MDTSLNDKNTPTEKIEIANRSIALGKKNVDPGPKNVILAVRRTKPEYERAERLKKKVFNSIFPKKYFFWDLG